MPGPWQNLAQQLVRVAVREGPRLFRAAQANRRTSAGSPGSSSHGSGSAGVPPAPGPATDHAGAARTASTVHTTAPSGRHLDYAPNPDGQADPGEVVWTWVQYEEDAGQGKDRPVLVVGRDGDHLYGLMLSSQHTRDGQHGWLALGSGPWDREGRPSWLRLDRVLEVPEAGIRREGAVLDRQRFDRVAAALRQDYGWA